MQKYKPEKRDPDAIAPYASSEAHNLHWVKVGLRNNPTEFVTAAREFARAYDSASVIARKLGLGLKSEFEAFAGVTTRLTTKLSTPLHMMLAVRGHNLEVGSRLAYDVPVQAQLVHVPPSLEDVLTGHSSKIGIFQHAAAGRVFADMVERRIKMCNADSAPQAKI